MENDEPADPYIRVFHKISALSKTLGEIDEWLETEGSAGSCRRPVTLDNLDVHIALDSFPNKK